MAVYRRLVDWLREERGQTLTEYALILVLVSIAVIVLLTALGTQINAVFQLVVNALTP